MTPIREIWRAGRTRRWHTHADLSHTNDFLDGHSARVVKLMLALDPAISRDALLAALTHDDGEPAVGDMSYQIKINNPLLAAQLNDMEEDALFDLWGPDRTYEVIGDDRKLLDLCDRLDSWLWVEHHAPATLREPEWVAMRAKVLDMAAALGMQDQVLEALS